MIDTCPHCGTTLPAVRDAFCPDCRGDLEEAPERPPTPQPAQTAPATGGLPSGNVWYATEQRVHAPFKFAPFDDRGRLERGSQGIRFSGKGQTFWMRRIHTVELVGPGNVWGSVVAVVFFDAVALLGSALGAFGTLTPDNLLTYAVLAVPTALFLLGIPRAWVRVQFEGDTAQLRTAYFTDASLVGRWAGGAKRLYSALAEPRLPSP